MKQESINKTFKLGGEITINRIGYGAMRITGDGVWGMPADKENAIKVLQKAVELGVNFIDTADSYGPHVSEELIAEALYPYKEGLVIATKGGLERTGPNQWPVNGHPKHLQEVLDGSLKRLKLEQIDLYQLHRIDPKVPVEDQMNFLKNAQEQGKIKHIGLSEVDVDDIKKAMEYFTVASVQNMYSYGNRKWEDVLKFTEENNIAFIPWYPLDAGNPAGEEKLKKIADNHNSTVHQVALNWLLNHASNLLLIPGTANLDHLEENMGALQIELSEEDMAFLG
ncbi:MAG: putative oxidoreductase YdbC [Bacteroidota bacterium]|jgi:aryl-alcohol dehydrogenase-like predicted oxidoreductase